MRRTCLTPAAIRQVHLERGWWIRGYRRRPIDTLLEEIADSFESLCLERDNLSAIIEELDAKVTKQQELEILLSSTLLTAERAALDTKEQARRESDRIVQEGHADARRVRRQAEERKREVDEDILRISAQLRVALDVLAGPESDSSESEEVASVKGPTPIEEELDGAVRKMVG